VNRTIWSNIYKLVISSTSKYISAKLIKNQLLKLKIQPRVTTPTGSPSPIPVLSITSSTYAMKLMKNKGAKG